MDAVDKILAQWAAERPDLDTTAMGPIGRFSRVAHGFSRRMGETFANHELNASSFDVLATLRRSPPPHALSAGELMGSMMITSGTMTNRIDQLVKAGLVSRSPDPEDARRAVVKLTAEGFKLIDAVMADHVQTQGAILSDLNQDEVAQLDALLRKLMTSMEGKSAD